MSESENSLSQAALFQRGRIALVRELGEPAADRFIEICHDIEFPAIIIPSSAVEMTDSVATAPPSQNEPPVLSEGIDSSQRRRSDAAYGDTTPLLPFPAMDEQSWDTGPSQIPAESSVDLARQALIAAVESNRLVSIEHKTAYVLHHFPETRDNYAALCIRYWRHFQPDVLEKNRVQDLQFLFDLELAESLSRARRKVQNDLRLFEASAFAAASRKKRQQEFHEYLALQSNRAPEIRFYLDETGTDQRSGIVGIGGVCIIDYRQYEIAHNAIRQWRDDQGWVETIHFADLDDKTMPRAIELLTQLGKRRAGLLFVAHSILGRSASNRTLSSLFVQLITDSLKWIARERCLEVQKCVTVYKEAEAGFDSLALDTMRHELHERLSCEFPDRVFLKDVTAIPKGGDVMLECADLIAAAMRRRSMYGGRNPKDKLAEAVFNVAGFGVPAHPGALFKVHAPHYQQ